jgi:hypothetical protein
MAKNTTPQSAPAHALAPPGGSEAQSPGSTGPEPSTTSSGPNTTGPGPSTTDLAPSRQASLASMQGLFEQYSDAGISDRPEDSITPFIVVLQKLSPQLEKRSPAYVHGAQDGFIYNTATGKMWDTTTPDNPLLCLLAASESCEVEWVPRLQGGGFVAKHSFDTPLLRQVKEVPDPADSSGQRKIRVLPNGHQLVTTAYKYLILVNELTPVVMGLSSTGLMAHRRLNKMLKDKLLERADGTLYRPAAFATLLGLRTVYNENARGNWYTPVFEDLGPVNEKHMTAVQMAAEFAKQFMSGEVKVAEPPVAGGSTTGTIDGQASSVNDDEMPF